MAGPLLRCAHDRVLILLFGFGIGGGAALVVAGATGYGRPAPSPSPVVSYIRVPVAVPIPVAPTVAAPPGTPTIEEGTWVVGVDIPAGRYRVTANVSSECYWGIYKSGTNGSQIIASDIPGGGRPTVTLKVGQDFVTHRCGTWEKIG